MKNKLLAKLIAVLLLATSINAFADGVGYGSTVPGQIAVPGLRFFIPQEVFVYAAAGEKVSFSFGKVNTYATPSGSLSIKIFSPNGLVQTLSLPPETTAATNKTDSILVNTGTTGIWRILLEATNTNNAWRYDVNALSASDLRIPGRVYTENLTLAQGGGVSQNVSFPLYYVEKDGYQYTANFKEYNGIDSWIRSDKFGVSTIQNGRCVSTYSSSQNTSLNTCGSVYKQFFVSINVTLPAKAPIFDGTNKVEDWLNPPVAADPTITGLTYTSTNIPATPLAGNFSFALTEYTGNATLLVDVNNNGVYTDAVDRSIPFSAIPGSNTVAFNGLNGAGVAVSCGSSLKARVLIDKIGEIHFTMSDVETIGGLTVTRTNGSGNPSSILYWNDLNLTTAGKTSLTSPLDGRAGIPSNTTTGVHGWAFTGEDQWGNGRAIDNWAYRPINVFQEISATAACPIPDLTPTLRLTPAQIVDNNKTINMRVVVAEINGVATTGGIFVTIPVSSHYTMNPYSTTLASSAGLPVQNSRWSYNGISGTNHVFTYGGTAAVTSIAANSSSAFGFSVIYSSNAQSGTENVVVSIFDGGGGEKNFANNKDNENINFSSTNP